MPLKFIPTNVKYNDSGEFKNISIPADRAYMGEVITVSSTQPTNSDNKLWINTNEQTKQTYQIPTMTDMETADNTILGNLATIESSPATAAHAVGEYIVYNGQLYKVTAAISPGETLTVGTNIAAVSNGGFNELNAFGNPYFQLFSKPNVTCNGNSSAIVDISIGDVPSGWAATAVTSWVDGTDTTNPANMYQIFLLNEWSHVMQTGTNKTMHLMYSNLNSNQAKFTANMLVMYTRV